MPKDEHPDDGEERNHPMSDRDPSDGVRIVGEDGEPPLRLSDDTGPSAALDRAAHRRSAAHLLGGVVLRRHQFLVGARQPAAGLA